MANDSSPAHAAGPRFGDAGEGAESEFAILPLLADAGNRRVLIDWLVEEYAVVESDEPRTALGNRTVDLCILDPPSFEQHREKLIDYKETQLPHHVPYLLVRNQNSPLADAELYQYIDDVVEMPVEKQTLGWRIDSMLSLRTLSVTLEENRRQLEELAKAAAHDLRNPLNVAKGHVEMIDDGRSLDRIAKSLDRMEHLIDDLLAVVRSAGAITAEEYEWVELAPLVAESRELTDIAEDRLRLEGIEGYTIRGKPRLIEQLLDNLLRNAAEHGGDGVTVRVGRLESEPGFYVEDDGVGVPEDLRVDVFDSGYTTASGSGIGLQVVQRVSTAHGWDITLTESGHGGARFEFSGVDTR